MHEYSNVEIIQLDDKQLKDRIGNANILSIQKDSEKSYSILVKGDSSNVLTISVDESLENVRSGSTGIIISLPKQKYLSYLLKFSNQEDALSFNRLLGSIKSGKSIDGNEASQFDERTEESSAEQYFQFYGYLSQQQNMMQDYIRTSTYQRAILDNSIDFAGKVVLDVGAGSGILSFFAAQAGARKVYAVEASSMAQHAKTLVDNNHLSNRIQLISGKIEEITLPEQVDVIISEPMGYMLYNERMLESYIHAKKFLKPNGKMYPTTGDLYVTPFTDEALYM
jgi:histone-arginine methyltransferase CARM1